MVPPVHLVKPRPDPSLKRSANGILTHAEEGGYIALNPETGTTTQGETIEQAIHNLKEATALYLAEFTFTTHGHPVVTTFTVPAHA